MLEMKITIAAPELSAAVNNLAAALEGKRTASAAKAGTAVAAAPSGPANPIAAPVAIPAQALGAPLSATPARMVTPAVPTVPVAAPAPAATPAANAASAPAVPTSAPQYTLEMIATAGSALLDAGNGAAYAAARQIRRGKSHGACARELRSRCKRIKSHGRSDMRRTDNANT